MKKLLILSLLLLIGDMPSHAKKLYEISIGADEAVVLKNFGKPDLKTVDADNKNSWVYQNVAKISAENNSNFGNVSTKTKNIILIVKFDENKTVESFTYQKGEIN